MNGWPDNFDPRERGPIVCAACLAEGRAQRLSYALNTDRHVCVVHGPRLTGEYLWALAPYVPEVPWYVASRPR